MTAITSGLAKSRKYKSTITTAAMIGRERRSFVLGFNLASSAYARRRTARPIFFNIEFPSCIAI